MIDLLVAGGGPAGLAAAIAARRAGMDVLVVEPRAGVIDKACGEGIMPAGVAALGELGVALDGVSFDGVRYRHARVQGLGASLAFPRGVRGLGVRRTMLSAALLDRARALGVRFERGRVLSLEPRRARFVIGADGLRSDVRRLVGAELPARRPPRLGMRRHFTVEPWSDRVEVYLGEGAEAYVTPVAADTVGVALLFEGRARWDELLARFPALTRRLARAAAASSLRGGGPFERRVARRVAGDVLLVGDAAGYVDPLTGEGIALGVQTALAAVSAILAGEPDRYEVAWRSLTRRHRALTRALVAVVGRPRLHAPFIAAARALPSVFDAALSSAGGQR